MVTVQIPALVIGMSQELAYIGTPCQYKYQIIFIMLHDYHVDIVYNNVVWFVIFMVKMMR